jgi:hypothetical protein
MRGFSCFPGRLRILSEWLHACLWYVDTDEECLNYPFVREPHTMRRVLLAIAIAGGAMFGAARQAEAFHHVIRARCINYYPGLYSYGYCGAPCPPPYTFPCAWSYPKYCGPWAGCYDGRVLCGQRRCGLGLCHRGWGHFAGLGCGVGYSLCGSRCCGSAACGYGYCGDCCASLSCGGCDSCGSGCVGGNCDAGASGSNLPSGSFKSGDEKILYDGPAENAPKLNSDAPPAPEPQPDSSTGIFRNPFRLASNSEPQGEGLDDYNRGMRAYWDGNMTAALEGFEAAVNAEPRNPLYAYYRALSMYNLQGADAANDWLAEAVELEREKPIAGWGKRMERVQGRARLWVEKARADAGIR